MSPLSLWRRTIEEQQADDFVGRVDQLNTFRAALAAYPPRYLLAFISGQGGVGKTQLLKQYQRIAREQGYVIVESDEQSGDIPGILDKFAKELADAGLRLKQFEQKVKRYHQLRQEIEADIEPPANWANTLGRITARVGLALTDEVPILRQSKKVVNEDAIAEYSGELTGYLVRKLGNKHDEVELMAQPATVLSTAFFDNLISIIADRRLLLCFDNYEFTQSYLDPWFATLPKDYHLPDGLRLVVAGRSVPDVANQWQELIKVTLHISLDVFAQVEADQYLDQHNVQDPTRREENLNLSGRLPILMSLLASEAESSATFGTDTTSSVVDRYLRWIDDPARREIALHAALPRFVDQEIVELLTPDGQDTKALFEWLRQRPFVTKRAVGWQYHSIVRRLFVRYLRDRGDDYRQIHNRLEGFFDDVCNALSKDGANWESREWVHAAFDRAYHGLLVIPDARWPSLLEVVSSNLGNLPMYGVLVQEYVQDPILQDELSPQQFEDVLLLASTLQMVNLGSWSEGLPLLDRLCQLSYAHPELGCHAFLQRGLAHRSKGNFEAAITDLELVLKKEPQNAFASYEKAVALHQMQAYDEALNLLGQVLDISSDSDLATRAKERTAFIYMDMGQYSDALRFLFQALEDAPERFWHHVNLARVHTRMGNNKKALASIETFLQYEPKNSFALAFRGDLLNRLGRYKDAIECLQRSIELGSDSAYTNVELGIAYRNLLNIDQALVQIEKARQLDPDYPWSLLERGITYQQLGEYDKALIDFNYLLESNLVYSSALVQRAYTYRDLGCYKEALDDMALCRKLHPDDSWTLKAQADILRSTGEYSESLTIYDRYLDHEPADTDALIGRGQAYYLLGQTDRALSDFERALEIAPLNVVAMNNRAWINFTTRRYEATLADALAIIEIGLRDALGIRISLKVNILLPLSGMITKVVAFIDSLAPDISRGLHVSLDTSLWLTADITKRLSQLLNHAGVNSPWKYYTFSTGWLLSQVGQYKAALDCYQLYRSRSDDLYIRYAMVVTRAAWKGRDPVKQDIDQLRTNVIQALTDQPDQPMLEYILLGIDALQGQAEDALLRLDSLLDRADYLVEYAHHDLAFKSLQETGNFQHIVATRYTPQVAVEPSPSNLAIESTGTV